MFHEDPAVVKAAADELATRTLRTVQMIELATEIKRHIVDRPQGALKGLGILQEYGKNPRRDKEELRQYVRILKEIKSQNKDIAEQLEKVQSIWLNP